MILPPQIKNREREKCTVSFSRKKNIPSFFFCRFFPVIFPVPDLCVGQSWLLITIVALEINNVGTIFVIFCALPHSVEKVVRVKFRCFYTVYQKNE